MVFELIYDNKQMYFHRQRPSMSVLRVAFRRKDLSAHGRESSLVSAAAFLISELLTRHSENLTITTLWKCSVKKGWSASVTV